MDVNCYKFDTAAYALKQLNLGFKYMIFNKKIFTVIVALLPLSLFASLSDMWGTNKYLYVLCPASSNVFQGKIQSDGTVKALADPMISSFGVGPAYTDNLGKHLYMANTQSGTSNMFKIANSGQLEEVSGSTLDLNSVANGLFNTWRTPNNKFAFITGTNTNSVALIKIDPKTSILSINKTKMHPSGNVIVDNGVGVTHMLVTDQITKGKIFAYIDGAMSNTVTIYDVDQDTGDLISRDEVVSTHGVGARNNKLVKKGNNFYLYVVNEQSNNLSVFKILPSGSLEFKELIETGVNPIFPVVKDNKYLYLANKAENTISMFEIKDDGHLEGIINSVTGTNKMPTQGVEPFISNLQGDYLYMPCRKTNTVDVFKVESNGLLKAIQEFDLNPYSCIDSFIATTVVI